MKMQKKLEVKIAHVILALPFNQEFSYKIPGNIYIEIGSIVKVNFRKKVQIGVVINITNTCSNSLDFELKDVMDAYKTPTIPLKLLNFVKWVSQYNNTYLGSIIKMILLSRSNIEYNVVKSEYKKFNINRYNHNPVQLSDLQKQVVFDICKYGFKKYSSHLILGATGSGKTEVYLEIAQQVINNSEQVLILLPEILLATQLVERFKKRLKNCVIAEWNSSLTPKNKAIIWHGVINGEINVVVGARSALFLPFLKLKLVIIDEEHDGSFKQEEGIVYNARDMAIVKANIERFPILLSTATPSVETYYNTSLDKCILHRLPNRYTGVLLPKVEVVDLKQEKLSNSKWISESLQNEIINCLARKKLSMIFLNRRGYAPLTICNSCGEKFSCPNCQFFLVEHRKKNQMLCHYCGYLEDKLIKCAKCDSDEKLVALGAGIEKIEEEICSLFPAAKVISITSDTISNFKKASKIIEEIENKKYDIIIGTQMLAKGLNFPDLHLVGVIDSDISFAGCDLKILERTFQLLYQVAGRAGRQKEKGIVIIQTYFADNPILQYIKNWEYESFIKAELINRQDSFMPPFSKLVMLKGSSFNEESLNAFMQYIVTKAPINQKIEILGPAPAPIYKIRNKFRYRIILRSSKQINIQKYIETWFNEFSIPHIIKIKIDIDPYNFS